VAEPAHSLSSPQYGWLAAVLPSAARRFRTSDTALATVLASAGGEIVTTNADVEIADSRELHADTPVAVVSLDASQPEGGGRARRTLRRLVAAGRVSLLARGAAKEVGRRGYASVRTMRWEILQPLPLSGGLGRPRRLRAAEHLPQRALIIGSRGPIGPTVLDAVAGEAGGAQNSFRYGRPIASARSIVAIGHDAVMRVTIGPASQSLEAQFRALQALRAAKPPHVVAARVPWILKHGRLGLADWSLERRLPGTPHPATLRARLLEDCVEFLVELFRQGDVHASAPDDSIGRAAEAIAGVSAPRNAALISAAGREIADQLADLPHGFAHGDFWNGNLLTRHGRLLGVVDWDRAEPKALPLIDLIHLRLTALRRRTREYMGEGIARHLVPWARAGGDELTRSYCRQAEISLAPRQLEALVMAYWLLYVASELTTYADRSRRSAWMQKNVETLVRTVSTSASRLA
jgi:aminoglycoside phosphotransferase (APT) family kinase protein